MQTSSHTGVSRSLSEQQPFENRDQVYSIYVHSIRVSQGRKNEDIVVATDQSRRSISPHHENVTNLYPDSILSTFHFLHRRGSYFIS
jgi:hypothetical protein